MKSVKTSLWFRILQHTLLFLLNKLRIVLLVYKILKWEAFLFICYVQILQEIFRNVFLYQEFKFHVTVVLPTLEYSFFFYVTGKNSLRIIQNARCEVYVCIARTIEKGMADMVSTEVFKHRFGLPIKICQRFYLFRYVELKMKVQLFQLVWIAEPAQEWIASKGPFHPLTKILIQSE